MAAALAVALALPLPAQADLSGYAIVHDDGTLTVEGERLALYGVRLPPTDRTCLTYLRPVHCGPRAIVQLDQWLQGFVRCEVVVEYRDVSSAVCRYRGTDLAAWLLRQGWAVAEPGAPHAYAALQAAARQQGLGVWGRPVDRWYRSPPDAAR